MTYDKNKKVKIEDMFISDETARSDNEKEVKIEDMFLKPRIKKVTRITKDHQPKETNDKSKENNNN